MSAMPAAIASARVSAARTDAIRALCTSGDRVSIGRAAYPGAAGTRRASVERVDLTLGEPLARAKPVVGLEELAVVADVEPLTAERIGVDGHACVEPCHEVTRRVRRVAGGQILLDHPRVVTREDVRGRRRERR